MALRIIFMGTPEFAVPTLQALHDAGHEIVAVYTQPPRPGGRRGLEPVKSPVHRLAERLGLEVRTPVTLKDQDEQARFSGLRADVAVVVAYGLILPPPVLAAPALGALNGHASALPRWRGAAPIQRAIMAGDRSTAVAIMKMDEGLDTGPVALTRELAIGPDETGGELHDRMAVATAELMCEALLRLERGELEFRSQPAEGTTYAAKISKQETRIDWSRTAAEVHDHIRALSPVPGAWCEMEINGRRERVRVLASQVTEGSGQPGECIGPLTVACGSGAVRLLKLQRAGGRPLDAGEFLRGANVTGIT